VGPPRDTYTLARDSQPTADVTVTITTDGQTTIAPTSLVFTSANWNAPQTVTVTAVDDFTRELPVHPSTVTHSVSSTDVAYNGMALPDVIASVTDNDQACQDSDGDGLTDDEELAGFTATVYWLGSNQNWQSATVTFTTDPNNPDTDRDGISDFDEVMTYQDGTAEDGSVPGITTADGNPLISCDLRIGLKVYGPGTDFPPGSFEGRKPKSVWGVRTIAGPVSNPPPDLPNIDPKDSDGDGILDPDDPAPQFDPKVMYGSNPRIDQDKLVNFDLDGDGWVELP
jgi:hypothetical protein